MPRTRPLETYANRQFVALCQRVIDSQQPFTVPCTRPQAASMRGELHAWRRAAENDKDEATALGIPVAALREVSFRITDAGLECIPQSMLQVPNLIEAALGGAPKLESAADRALRRLREGLAGDDSPET